MFKKQNYQTSSNWPEGVTGDAAPCLGDLPPFLAEFSMTEGPKSMEDPATWGDEIKFKY